MFRQFTKTNAFELTIVFCIRMTTPFSSVVTPSPSNNVAKRYMDVDFFPTLKKGEGENTFHEIREENLHQGKRLLIFMCLNNFCS